MKIRNGFVSNSSSSSFIVFGKKIAKNRITKELIKEKKIYACGENLEEGVDFFLINEKMFNLYSNFGKYNLMFYNVDGVISEGGTISKDKIKDNNISVFCLDVSHHYTQEDDIPGFTSAYLDMKEIEQSPQELEEKAARAKEILQQIDKEGLEPYKDNMGNIKLKKKKNEDS